MSTYNIKYRTFDQLLDAVGVDMPTLHQEGMIQPAQLIKVAQRVNYDLGLKIHQEKEVVLEVYRGKAKLPDDFQYFNFAILFLDHEVSQEIPTGDQRESVILDGQEVMVTRSTRRQVHKYRHGIPVKVKPSVQVSKGCPNLRYKCLETAEIRNGYIHLNVDYEANLYIHYLGAMEDQDGNLLVVDHDVLNEYYEYAIKQRVLENMILEGEDVVRKLELIEPRLRAARNNALSITNTPDFAELKQIWDLNRAAMHQRFYAMFV